MKVLVCGGRAYSDKARVFEVLDKLQPRPTLIIHGNARGADALAQLWAESRKVVFRKFNAKWKLYGPAAGSIRNREMLLKGEPNLVVAFPGGKGTADMVGAAAVCKVPVLIVDQKEVRRFEL